MQILNNPTEITGCVLWLDGADSSTLRESWNDGSANVTDGDPVGYWADKSSNGLIFSVGDPAKRPTYVRSVSSIRFRSNSFTSLSTFRSSPALPDLNPCTIFVITALHDLPQSAGSRIFTTAAAGVQDSLATANSYIPLYVTTNALDIATFYNNVNASSIRVPELSTFNLLINRNSQASNGVLNFRNGIPSASTGTYTSDIARTSYRIGGGIANGTTGSDLANSFYAGYVAEIIAYDSALNTSDFTRVLNYLTNKWSAVQYIPKTIFALSSGNWTDTNLWSTSSYPAPFNTPLSGDFVYTNGFNISANIPTRVETISNATVTPFINGGGTITILNGVALSGNTPHVPYSPAFFILPQPGLTSTLVGNVSCSTNNSVNGVVHIFPNTSFNHFGDVICNNITNSSLSGGVVNRGTYNLFGNCQILPLGGFASTLVNSLCTFNMVGNVNALSLPGGDRPPISIGRFSSWNLTGNVVINGGGYQQPGVLLNANSVVRIIGDIGQHPTNMISRHTYGGALTLRDGGQDVYVKGSIRSNGISGYVNAGGTCSITADGQIIVDQATPAIDLWNYTGFVRLTGAGTVAATNRSQAIYLGGSNSSINSVLSVYGDINFLNATNGNLAVRAPTIQYIPVNTRNFDIFASGSNTTIPLDRNTTAFTKLMGLDFSKLVAGTNFVIAKSGTTTKWYGVGNGSQGVFGLGNTNNLNTFTQLPGDWDDMFAGYSSVFALSATTSTWFAAGNNQFGQLGIGNTISPITTFTSITGTWSRFVEGESFTYAQSANTFIWFNTGRNQAGQLGNGSHTNSSSFDLVSGRWFKVACGQNHAIALSAVTTIINNVNSNLSLPLYVVGSNSSGQCGLGSTLSAFRFLRIPGSYYDIAAGNSHSLVLSAIENRVNSNNRLLFSTGINAQGQLGLNNFTNRNVFTVALLDGYTEIAAGYNTSFVRANDGTWFAAGENTSGQLGNNSIVNLSSFSLTNARFPLVIGSSFTYSINNKYIPFYHRYSLDGLTNNYLFFTENTSLIPPISSDVVQGFTYNDSTLTGSIIVPSIQSVNAGVQVGQSVGTSFISINDFWNTPVSAISTPPNSIGDYLKKTLTNNALSAITNSLDFSKV